MTRSTNTTYNGSEYSTTFHTSNSRQSLSDCQDEITLLTRNFFFPLPTYPQRTSQSHKELRLNSNDDAVYDISDLVHAAYRGGAGSLKTGIIRGEAAETWGWNLRRYPDIEDNWLVVTQVT